MAVQTDIRWQQIEEEHGSLSGAAKILSYLSGPLAAWIIDNPDLLGALAEPVEPKTVQQIVQDILEKAPLYKAENEAAFSEILLSFYREEFLHIVTRDLLGVSDLDAISQELSTLAEGIIFATTEWLGEEAKDLCVLAMGKLGGMELNYISDVDVIFVHQGDSVKAERAAKKLLHIIGGEPHSIYEIDPNLRPEGRNGSLSRTVEGYQTYWNKWAKTWEAQAFLKARPIAGNLTLGHELKEAGKDFVWPEVTGRQRINEIQTMKRRVEKSKEAIKDGARQLKLAPGGLRDIEFTVQLLQLVHGHADKNLQVEGTLAALDALAKGGYVSAEDALQASFAYTSLRQIEHRVQLQLGRRSHTLPSDQKMQEAIALSLGIEPSGTSSTMRLFDKHILEIKRNARDIHERLFLMPLLNVIADYDEVEASIAAGKMSPEATRQRIRSLGFMNPKVAISHIGALISKRGRLNRSIRLVLPSLLGALGKTGDPDGGLNALRLLIERSGSHPSLQKIISDHPIASKLLATVLGMSPRTGSAFSSQPELLYLLEKPRELSRVSTKEELFSQIEHLFSRSGGVLTTKTLKRWYQRERLRILLRSIINQAEITQTGRELSNLADALLTIGLKFIMSEDTDLRICIVALGKFGARELAFGSDFDSMVIYEGNAKEAEDLVEKLVQWCAEIDSEAGPVSLDLKLRPGGKSGVITRSVEGTIDWLKKWADSWYLQALTMARPAVGDLTLGNQLIEDWSPLVFPEKVSTKRLIDIRAMKARIEKERASQTGLNVSRTLLGRNVGSSRTNQVQRIDSNGKPTNIKLSPGGLSDLEWVAQILAIKHGHEIPALQNPSTVERIELLVAHGIISAQDGEFGSECWDWLSRVRNALWLIGMPSADIVPANKDKQRQLALLLMDNEEATTQNFIEHTERIRRRVRTIFDRYFW